MSDRSRFARAYGADPLHLLAVLATFALAGYAAVLAAGPLLPRMLVWFAAAIIGHDLILFPLYALADRSLTAALRLMPAPRVSPANYLRIPALGAGLLFLVFFPAIIRQGHETYEAATGRTQQPYLGRWLLLVAAMFAVSAVAYALRLGLAPRRTDDPPPPRERHGSHLWTLAVVVLVWRRVTRARARVPAPRWPRRPARRASGEPAARTPWRRR